MDSPTAILTSVSTQTSLYNVSSSQPKRKRKPAGTPDPDAEVVVLSPRTLMESDRYVCEICNQGFQRDQNLQMHRRRHKVPWKLLKRAEPEVRKRVYVCPEPSCLHHNPCHALGDLVGIKKHYRRKHSSMKQWECDKCSKAYAVQSDYKAHLKTCGTRGHCCDCGRVFSRVESFIEHQDSCTASRNKRDTASVDDRHDTSLPSLAAAAFSDQHRHAIFIHTSPSSSAEKAVQTDTYHHNVVMDFPPQSFANDAQELVALSLPMLHSQYMHGVFPNILSSTGTSALTVPAISMASPSSSATGFLRASALLPQTSTSAFMVPLDAAGHNEKVSLAERQENSLQLGVSGMLSTHSQTELRLLPGMPHSSQLESSQSSNVCTRGKDSITSTNSMTSATICSSPGKKCVDPEKQAAAIPIAQPQLDIEPCKLQLSIGFLQDDCLSSGNRSRTSMPRLNNGCRADGNDGHRQKTDPNLPWLAWRALHAREQENHSSFHSSCTATESRRGIISLDTDVIRLELATGTTSPGASPKFEIGSPAVAWPDSNTLHNVKSFEVQTKKDIEWHLRTSYNSTVGLGDGRCNLRKDERNHLSGTNENPQRWPSLSSDYQTSNRGTALGLQQRPDEDQPDFMLSKKRGELVWPKISGSSTLSPLAAEGAAQFCLQRAREKLKRATEEKLDAEKAWAEAKREEEEAEAEVTGLRLATDCNNTALLGQHREESIFETRRPICRNGSASSCLTLSNSLAPMSNSSSSCQVAASSSAVTSLQMQLNAGGGIVSSAPSFITCPSCHHRTQFFNLQTANQPGGTLFLPFQELSTPALALSSCPRPLTRSFSDQE